MTAISSTDYSWVAGLKSFRALGNFTFNFFTHFESFEPFPLNGRVGDETDTGIVWRQARDRLRE
jgi:hypothetical protein